MPRAPPSAESPARIREMFPFLYNEYTPLPSQNIPFLPMGSSYSTGSACKGLNERICKGNPNCTYTINGCVRRRGTVKGGLVFKGPSVQFGKKRRSKGRKSKGVTKKLPTKIRNLCKRLKIKTTKRVGRRRVYKPIKTLMKQIRMRMKKMKKTTRGTRHFGNDKRSTSFGLFNFCFYPTKCNPGDTFKTYPNTRTPNECRTRTGATYKPRC